MEKYVLFGAGQYGKMALNLIGKEKIEFFVDNSKKKAGTYLESVPIYYFYDVMNKIQNYKLVLTVSEQYQQQLIEQLKMEGMNFYQTFSEIQIEITKEKINKRVDYIQIYKNALKWIHENTINGEAIICNTGLKKAYPEVTGYYIPTLIRWGYRDLAISYAKWLCKIQKEDGSWYDAEGRAPYVFDSAQILKGLLAIREIYPKVDVHIKKGCDWILSNIEQSGRLTTPSKEAWGTGRMCSELIHIYCLSPLVEAGKVFGCIKYEKAAYKVLNYYKTNYLEEIMNFRLLSHFYAYVMEGLLDMGEVDMVREAMKKVAMLQKKNGAVAGYYDVDWVCSTGLFQFALVWFRLGEIELGRKAFCYACKLQNKSGGWYGSYLSEENKDEKNDYIPTEEISWAVKYFLDALYYKNIAEFNDVAESFLDKIDKEDGRYLEIKKQINKVQEEKERKPISILDVGCGKGRYLVNLVEDESENDYFAVDLSEKVMEFIPISTIIKRQGSLTNIPFIDNTFDLAYTCEALEHVIDVESAIRELCRVVNHGGKIVIIDKNIEHLGCLEIGESEQWFEEKELKNIMEKFCSNVEVKQRINYENNSISGLFSAWIGVVK